MADTTAESATAAKRRMRRIPEQFRKRNAQSCDLCRKRRCKCVPAQSGTGCVTCQEHSVACSYTTPRKTRFYGSVDDLSDRYRCLQAIVKGAFPNDDTATAADLLKLGQRLGYEMPEISREARSSVNIGDLVQSGNAKSRSASDNPGCVASLPMSPHPRTRSSSEEPHISLVRDTAGNEHYIGPSGTLNFLSQLRKLVDTSPAAAEAANAEGAAKFSQDNMAQALEADDEELGGTPEDPTVHAADRSLPADGHSPGSMTSAIARDFTRLPATDMNEILREFPPGDTLELLIHSYFKNVHDDFPLFHRATFEDEYELFVVKARNRPPLAREGQRPLPDWGWIGCLHMMIVFGSISNPTIRGVDQSNLRRKSVTVTRTLLPQFISKCSLSNVRVLLLLSLFLHNNNERNAAWNLVGTATRISFALGLHRSDMSSSFRPLEREVRKWVFCTLYSFEQFLASSLGRPSGLQEVDVEIVPPREGFLDGGGGSDAKVVMLSLKLQGILAKTRLMHLPKRNTDVNPPNMAPPSVDEVLKYLNDWKRQVGQLPGFDLPWVKTVDASMPDIADAMDLEELKVSLAWKTRAQLRAVLLIHIQYHYIAITATRPILLREIAKLRKTNQPLDSDKGGMSGHAVLCVEHATQLSYIILLLDSFNVINGLSGLDIFYAYCAAMVLLLRLLRTPPPQETDASASSHEPAQLAEDQVQASLRALVGKVQEVIGKADKSGSMRRFASVVDTFAECVNRPSQRIYASDGHHPLQHQYQNPSQHLQSAGRAADGLFYGHGVSAFDGMMPDQLHPAGVAQFGNGGGGGYDNLLGSFFPLSTFGLNTIDGSPYGQMTGTEEDVPVLDWANMEYLLGGYGVLRG